LKNNHAFSFGLCEQGEKDEYEDLAEKICSSAVVNYCLGSAVVNYRWGFLGNLHVLL